MIGKAVPEARLPLADVRPFRGLRFDPTKIPDLGAVISPPYDVISPQERAELCRRSEHNVIRLELPEESSGADPYAAAAQYLHSWRRDGIVLQEERPAIYLVRHEFTYLGRSMTRSELIVALRLEKPGGSVRPHEDTRAKAKADRMNLMLATAANISPVMLLFDGKLDDAPAGSSALEADPGGDERFTTWPITDAQAIRETQEALASRPVYIADGHHRYETALAYQERRTDGAEASGFVMTGLISFSDPGLLLLPYHRLLKGLDPQALTGVRERMDALFDRNDQQAKGASPEVVGSLALERLNEGAALFAVWGLKPDCLSFLTLKSSKMVDEIEERGHSRAWAGLAAAVFREAVLLPILGMHEEEAEVAGKLAFDKDASESVQRVLSGECQMAVMPAAVPFDVLKEVSDRGERLPPKSTYFYPKLPTGLVMRSLDGAL